MKYQDVPVEAKIASTLALDLSTTAVGYSLWREDGSFLKSGVFRPKFKDYFDRIMAIEGWLRNMIGQSNIFTISIEGYAFSRHSSSVTKLAELHGVVKMELHMWDYDLKDNKASKKGLFFSPTSWKKFCFNKGNLAKDQVMVKTLSKYGEEFLDDNEADAYCLGKLTVAFLNAQKDIWPKEEYAKEALKKIL